MTPIEIERKFLIRMPSEDILKRAVKKDMVQTYLHSNAKETSRVRKITCDEQVSYIKTVKSRISDLSHFEDEHEISEAEYYEELKKRDTSKKDIEKSRYCIEYERHILEIDIYPFWADRAILEIELKEENESFDIPCFIDIIKEVSDDKRYKNTNLAFDIPMDKI